MENFKVNEYFKDYVTIQKTYFDNLKQLTEPKEIGGRLESQVMLNGEGYKKIERITDEGIYILLVPNENLQELPVIELTATMELINIETYKLINKKTLEHTTYSSLFGKKEIDVVGAFSVKYFDVSDEIDNDRYILKYGMLLELGKDIGKQLIGSKGIFAKRDSKRTIYSRAHHGYLIESVIITNKSISLFETIMNLSDQMSKNNKTK